MNVYYLHLFKERGKFENINFEFISLKLWNISRLHRFNYLAVPRYVRPKKYKKKFKLNL